MARLLFFAVFLILGFSSGCRPFKLARTDKISEIPEDRILLVELKAWKTAPDLAAVSILNTQVAPGRLKPSVQKDFICPVTVEILDPAQIILTTETIEHPLVERLEYSENSREIKKIITIRDSAEILVRTRLLTGSFYMRVLSESTEYPRINTTMKIYK